MRFELHANQISYERVRRLMRKANVRPIYPRKYLTVLGEKKYIHPYLLNGSIIERVNQVWAIDITYIPVKNGFMYLTAIIDVYSSYIVGWGLSNSLDAQASLEVVERTVSIQGKPEILNSDQGVQFTCEAYISYLKEEKISTSMDSKGRALDNIYMERFWRTLKYQHVYLNPADNGLALHQGIQQWLERYHNKAHQGINRKKPTGLYHQAA